MSEMERLKALQLALSSPSSAMVTACAKVYSSAGGNIGLARDIAHVLSRLSAAEARAEAAEGERDKERKALERIADSEDPPGVNSDRRLMTTDVEWRHFAERRCQHLIGIALAALTGSAKP